MPSQSHVDRGQILPSIDLPDAASASSGGPAPATPLGVPPKTEGVSCADEVNTLTEDYKKAGAEAKQ